MGKKKYIIFIFIISIIALSYFAYDSFAGRMDEPIPSIEIKSENANYDSEEAGAWKVTKSAKWKNKWQAKVTIDVNTVAKSDSLYRDYVLVLDTSVSMEGNKINVLKNNARELVEDLLTDDGNKVSLISFNTNSSVLKELTIDKESLLQEIDSLIAYGDTNYYKALVSVDEVLEHNTNDRDAVVLFLTDGYPNLNTPNEVAQYKYLKNKYKNVSFVGIQYEMGDKILLPLKNITENQYIADMENLHNVLFDAVKKHLNYSEFVVTDFVDDRYFENVSNISVTVGKVELINNKIVWNANNLVSGDLKRQQLTFNIDLRRSYQNMGGIYSTNNGMNIKTKIGDLEDNISVDITPKLSDKYIVSYDINAPGNCNLSNLPNNEENFVFDIVKINDVKYSCNGYQFKGWEMKNDNVISVNDDYFVMPEANVEFTGVWSKLNVSKSADGTISKVQTLYGVMQDQAVLDNIRSDFVTSNAGINFSSIASNSNGKGVYEVSSSKNDEYPTYYYRGAVQNNNVLFADVCWKAVVSTPTGGVKLVYNGLPKSDGSCNNTGVDSQIGTNYYSKTVRFADVGYMPGIHHAYENKDISSAWYTYIGRTGYKKTILLEKKNMRATNYYYSDSINWDEEKQKYVLSNVNESSVTQLTWESNYSKLGGKYTCFSTTSTECSTVYYISKTFTNSTYYIQLSGGNLNKSRMIGNNPVYDSETNMYTLNNVVDVSTTWYPNYGRYANREYYFCDDLVSTTCSKLFYIYTGDYTTATGADISNGETYDELYNQAKQTKWLFGNDIDSNGKLLNTIELSPVDWNKNYDKIANNHYTCFSASDVCDGQSVPYIYYSNSSMVRYMPVPKGQKLGEILDDLLAINLEHTSSTIKGDTVTEGTIDYWYYNNIELKGFSKYIEDTVYCNDRSAAQKNGWEPNGGVTTGYYLYFGPYNRTAKPSTTCPRKLDSFTVSDSIGNGLLTYPVGLLTADEARLAGASSGSNISQYLYTGQEYWLGSPYSFHTNGIDFWRVSSSGLIGTADVYQTKKGVRPVISLKPKSIIAQGDGTSASPYQIEMED